MKRREAIKWLIKPTVTSTEISPTKIKELEAYNMAIEALSENNISKKEIINYAMKCADGYSYIELPLDEFVDGINALVPEPTVIRSRTLMPTKDFKEWAKRVRETNPNAIVIPCDAEIVSAEAEEAVLNKMLEDEMIVLPQDYVKVVRCKACSHRVHDEERGLYYCKMYYGQGDVSDENFCQWGERSEKE